MEQAIGTKITERDRKRALECFNCALCREPQKQAGMPRWLLQSIERVCPYRSGYEKVYNRKAHEASPSNAAPVV